MTTFSIIRVVDAGGNGYRRADCNCRTGVLSNFQKTGPLGSPKELGDFVCEQLSSNTAGIAVSMAGVIGDKKIVVQSPNIPKLLGVDLNDLFSISGQKTLVFNDMDAAGVGMAQLTNIRGKFLALTWSSGIGARIVEDGKIVNTGAEMSHFVIDPSPYANLCGCRLRGCVESVAGGEAIKRRVINECEIQNIEIPKGMHPCRFLDVEYGEGKQWACEIYKIIKDAMARFFATIVTCHPLSTVVYKGTFAKSAIPLVGNDIIFSMRKYLMLGIREMVSDFRFIESPDPVNDAFVGAAQLFLQNSK